MLSLYLNVALAAVVMHTVQCFHQSSYVKVNINSYSKLLMSSNPTVTSLSSPPTTFIDCARQAAVATRKCIDEEKSNLIEVEFPPLPLEYLEDSSSSARDIADANTRWAIEFAKSFTERGQVSIIYPDQPELADAIKYVDMKGGANPFPNITLSTIRSDSIENARSIDQILGSIFGATVGGTVASVPNTKMYIALISSTQELTDLEKLHLLDPTIPIVFFNLRLDILVSQISIVIYSLIITSTYTHTCTVILFALTYTCTSTNTYIIMNMHIISVVI